MNITFAFLILSCVSMTFCAEIQRYDSKTFDPIVYFKRDLQSLKTNQPKQAQIKIYCNRLHQYTSALFCQQRMVESFCHIIPIIDSIKKYEKYRLVEGLIFIGSIVKSNENLIDGSRMVDAYNVGLSESPGYKGLMLLKSLPAIALHLSVASFGTRWTRGYDSDKDDQVFSVLQSELENPSNEEAHHQNYQRPFQ